MNFKKKIASFAFVVSLIFGCAPQAQASGFSATAGLVTGVYAGFCIPAIITDPISYFAELTQVVGSSAVAAIVLGALSGSIKDKDSEKSDFQAGFSGGFKLGVGGLPIMLLLALVAAH